MDVLAPHLFDSICNRPFVPAKAGTQSPLLPLLNWSPWVPRFRGDERLRVSDSMSSAHVLKRVADQMVKRDRATAADEEVEHCHRPHQGVFEPELVPELLADPPALDICHDQEKKDRKRSNTGEQPEREHRPADELGDRDRGRPELAGAVTVVVELGGKLRQLMGAHAGLG